MIINYFILQVLPYIAIPVLVIGLLYRLGRWASARIIHNITLTPAPTTKGGAMLDIAKEATFFRSLFKSGDKKLWAAAWIMHVSLFFIIAGHVVGIGFLGRQFAYLGITSAETSEMLSSAMGTFFGILLLVSLIYLLYRRFSIKEVKAVSAPADYIMLLLIIALVAAGNFMRFFPEWGIEYAPVREYVQYIITLTPITFDMEVMHQQAFIVHLLLAELLMIVFPFSKLLHAFGMLVNRHIINRPYVEPAPGLPRSEDTSIDEK